MKYHILKNLFYQKIVLQVERIAFPEIPLKVLLSALDEQKKHRAECFPQRRFQKIGVKEPEPIRIIEGEERTSRAWYR